MDYKKLQKDIASGKLDANKVGLYIDKDMAWGFDRTDSLSDEEWEEKHTFLEKEYGESCGKEDFWELLQLVGIHAEEC